MGLCLLCQPETEVPDYDLLDHLRVLHPDAYGDGPERWPDGEIVLHDTTLESDEFGGDAMTDLDNLLVRMVDGQVQLEPAMFDKLMAELRAARQQLEEYEYLRATLVNAFELGAALRPAMVAKQVIIAYNKATWKGWAE